MPSCRTSFRSPTAARFGTIPPESPRKQGVSFSPREAHDRTSEPSANVDKHRLDARDTYSTAERLSPSPDPAVGPCRTKPAHRAISDAVHRPLLLRLLRETGASKLDPSRFHSRIALHKCLGFRKSPVYRTKLLWASAPSDRRPHLLRCSVLQPFSLRSHVPESYAPARTSIRWPMRHPRATVLSTISSPATAHDFPRPRIPARALQPIRRRACRGRRLGRDPMRTPPRYRP